MARDIWKLRRVLPRFDTIKRTLTIPAFSLNCGFQRGYFYIPGLYDSGVFSGGIPSGTEPYVNACTIEAWIKISFPDAAGRHIITQLGDLAGTTYQISLEHENGNLIFGLLKGASWDETTSISKLPINQWVHVAGTWDGTNTALYINGVLDISTNPVAAPLDNITGLLGATYLIGRRNIIDVADWDTFVGFVDEIRYWTVARTQEEILNSMNSKRNAVAANGVDDDLYAYWSLDDPYTNGTGYTFDECDTNNASFANGSEIIGYNGEGAAPLGFNGSFVAGQYEIDRGHKVSIANWPLVAPNDCNFSLVVRWTDDSGIIQRRLLFGSGNLDYAPAPMQAYAGESLNNPFYLEVWNDDGEETADLASDYIIKLSEKTSPTSSTDQTAVNTSLTVDSTLAQAFPLTPFPLTFGSQQTY